MCHIPFCPYVAKAATKFRRSMKCVVLTECVNVSITLNGHVLYLNKGMNYWCTHTDMQFWILNTGFKLGTSCHVLLISLQSCQMLETFVCFHVPQCMIFNPNVWIGLLWGRSSSLACAMPVNHKEKEIFQGRSVLTVDWHLNVQMTGLDMRWAALFLCRLTFIAIILYMCLPEDKSKLYIMRYNWIKLLWVWCVLPC